VRRTLGDQHQERWPANARAGKASAGSSLITFGLAALGLASSPALAAPGDLYAAGENGDILRFTPGVLESVFATLPGPVVGLAFDRWGDLYASGGDTGSIYEFAPDGTRTIFASGANAGELAFDRAGNLFATAGLGAGGAILKFAADGSYSIFDSNFHAASGLAFDSADNLFVEEQIGLPFYIYEYDSSGVRSRFSSVHLGVALSGALAFDSSGNLYATGGGGSFFKLSRDGTGTTFSSTLAEPAGLAFDGRGTLFAADTVAGAIYEFASDGTGITFATGLSSPTALAFQPAVPEPSWTALLALGGGLVVGRRKN